MYCLLVIDETNFPFLHIYVGVVLLIFLLLVHRAQTALHKAAWYGYRGICKILVEANASLLRTDYQVSY